MARASPPVKSAQDARCHIKSVMTRILLTNDDGIHSNGLIKLEEALKEVGDVYVVAPASEMSGASHSLTLARPLRIRQIDDGIGRSTAHRPTASRLH